LDGRYEKNPERFVKGRPAGKLLPKFVAINPIAAEESDVNSPTLTAAGYVRGSGK